MRNLSKAAKEQNLLDAADVDDGQWEKPKRYRWLRTFNGLEVTFYPMSDVLIYDEDGFSHSVSPGKAYLKKRFMP